MSKILAASCVGGVVTAGGVPVPAATLLCQGVGASSGILVLDEDKAYYVALTSPDLASALEKLSTALGQAVTGFNKAADTFTATFAGMLGAATAPPPTGPALVAEITAAAAQITAAKTQLDTLNNMLR